jgi:hypothetical protein
MIELRGPAPEEMKPGETYHVVRDGEKLRLEKVESGNGQIVVLDLPPNIAYIMKVYAAILDDTLEGMILQILEQHTESLEDGEVLGEEIRAAY